MAQHTVITVTDDLDGSAEDVETLSFGFDGQGYEIDLGKANADAFREILAPLIAAGRKAPRAVATGRGKAVPRDAASRHDSAAVRAWAGEQGLKVSNRGRIPAAIVAAYDGR